jgi:hypothetical protein
MHEDVEDDALFIDGPPQLVGSSIYLQLRLIQVPLLAGSRPTATQFVGRSSLSELQAPLADGLVAYPYASLDHQLLYISR